MRTASTVDNILTKQKKNKNFLKMLCGLPVTTYFSAVKLRWLMDNVPEVQKAIDENRCMFGTIDTWLIWVTIAHAYTVNCKYIESSFKRISLVE